jgi:hypothetical protein
MAPALLASAVEQHCMASRAVGSDLEISHAADLAEENPGNLLIVSVDRAVSWATVANLQADGFRPERCISVSAALVSLLRTAGQDPLHDITTAIIHLGNEIGSVAFLVDGAFVIGREFRMPEAPSPSRPDADETALAEPPISDRQEEILEEINRSLLLLHHRFHGRQVQRLLLSADDEPLDELRRRCIQRFGVETKALIDTVRVDTTSFGEGELGRRNAGMWVLPIAAAVATLQGESGIDLMPAFSKIERARQRVMAIATAIVLASGAGMVLHHAIKAKTAVEFVQALEGYTTQQTKMDAQVADLVAIGTARTAAVNRMTLLSRKRAPLVVLQGALGTLAAAAPESLFVEQVDFGTMPGCDAQMTLRIKGKVSAANSADAQDQFSSLHAALQRNPLFTHATVRPLEIGHPPGGQQSVLNFDIVVPLNAEDGSDGGSD